MACLYYTAQILLYHNNYNINIYHRKINTETVLRTKCRHGQNNVLNVFRRILETLERLRRRYV